MSHVRRQLDHAPLLELPGEGILGTLSVSWSVTPGDLLMATYSSARSETRSVTHLAYLL